jgi:ADP-heptose:LPS heptosyltransferase
LSSIISKIEIFLASLQEISPWRIKGIIYALREYMARIYWPYCKKIYLARKSGLGDELFITALASAIKKNSPKCKVNVICTHFSLFEKNITIDKLIPYEAMTKLAHYKGNFVFQLNYEKRDMRKMRKNHIIDVFASQIGIKANKKLWVYLSDKEVDQFEKIKIEYGMYITVNARTSAWTENKCWLDDRWQSVIDYWSKYFTIIHIGDDSEPHFNNVIRLCGKTSIRDVFLLIKAAVIHIGPEGFLMHAANALGTKCVIIFGGYILPAMSGYNDNKNIFSQIECSPCLSKTCLNEYKHKCMEIIHVDQVNSEIKSLIDENKI